MVKLRRGGRGGGVGDELRGDVMQFDVLLWDNQARSTNACVASMWKRSITRPLAWPMRSRLAMAAVNCRSCCAPARAKASSGSADETARLRNPSTVAYPCWGGSPLMSASGRPLGRSRTRTRGDRAC